MDEIAKRNVKLAVSKNLAKKVLKTFPLARFSPLIARAIGETGDERASQNLFCLFQLREIRAMYILLQQQIPGMNIMFPIYFSSVDQENHYSILWVGDHDPYDLGDSILVHATTLWLPKDKNSGLTVSVFQEIPSFSGCHCGYSSNLARLIVRAISPELFNEIFRSFFTALHVHIPCPERDQKDYHLHPEHCDRCNGKYELLLHEVFGGKFRPSSWFQMVTELRGWDLRDL